MTDRSEVIRVQNDVLLNEYHHLIGAQIRRIDAALDVLDNERRSLMAEREHLIRHLPPPVEEAPKNIAIGKGGGTHPLSEVPKFIQHGPKKDEQDQASTTRTTR